MDADPPGRAPDGDVAGARHGTLRQWRLGCRCKECRAISTKTREMYRLGYAVRLDAAPVRRHLEMLRRTMTIRELATHTGVSITPLADILSRKTSTVLPGTAAKILAVTPINGQARIDATGTHRRIQAATTIGWTNLDISVRVGRRTGQGRMNVIRVMKETRITAALANGVSLAYEELIQEHPPDEYGNRRAKLRALRRKWAPPMAWDGRDMDDPQEEPDWTVVLCAFQVCGRSTLPGSSFCRPCGNHLREHGTFDGYEPFKNGQALVENALWISQLQGWPLDQADTFALVAQRLDTTPEALAKAFDRHMDDLGDTPMAS